MQVCDVSLNKPFKGAFRSAVHSYLASLVTRHMTDKPNEPLMLDLRISHLKPLLPSWLHAAVQHIRANPGMVLNGWRKCGTLPAINGELSFEASEANNQGLLFSKSEIPTAVEAETDEEDDMPLARLARQ